MKLWCLLSRNHRKTGLVDLLRVPHPSFVVNSTTPLDFRASGLSGSGLVLTCCKEGFENNPKKLQEAGFLHMQTQGGTCLPSGTFPQKELRWTKRSGAGFSRRRVSQTQVNSPRKFSRGEGKPYPQNQSKKSF